MYNTVQVMASYRIAGNFRMVLIFVYFVCSIPYTKIKTTKIILFKPIILYEIFSSTQSLAQLQVLTMSRYQFFAKASNSSPTAAVQILV